MTETANTLRLDSEMWNVEMGKHRFGIALENKQTGLVWRLEEIRLTREAEQHPVTLDFSSVRRIDRRTNGFEISCGTEGSSDEIRLEVDTVSKTMIRVSLVANSIGAKSKVNLRFAGGGPFFGLGERFTSAKLEGIKTTLRPEDLLGRADHNWTYIPVPFLFTPGGLGLYLDTGSITDWDLSSAGQQQFSVELDQGTFDSYFFVGSPKSILNDYTSLTGRIPVPPPWAFGIWICSYQGPAKVLEDARRLRQNQIPSSAIWLFDAMGKGDIMGWPLWWTGYYPRPRHLTDQLHDLGFKVLTYIHPYLRSVLDPYVLPNPNFEEAAQKKFFVLTAKGEPSGPRFERYLDGNLDFTNPEATKWWEEKIRTILLDDNFDGWMEDFGEWVNDTDRFASGKNGREMTNLYPLLYHQLTYEIATKAKPDVVGFVRSGYAGSQASTRVVWGGDQFPDWTATNGLPSVVPAGITAGLSGFAVWGPDIASNGHSKELWMRWTEFGALTPVMRDHLWDKPPGAVDLWYDSETTDLFRNYAQLHVSLFPYFYSYAHEAAQDGLPIIRHPMLEFPDDPKAYDAEQEYLLGEHLLVAPVVQEGATTRSLYLPKGNWIDYWTGNLLQGGAQVTIAAPLKQIPLLVQAGSIIPEIRPDTASLAQDLAQGKYSAWQNNLIWRLFPSVEQSNARFALYDGTLAVAEQGSSRTTVRVSNAPILRNYEVILNSSSIPKQVSLANELLKRINDSALRDQQRGWWFDQCDNTIHVLFSANNFDLAVIK